jgi:hypothetical protein
VFEVVEWVPSQTTHRTFVPAEMVRLLGRKAKLTILTRVIETVGRTGTCCLPA